MNLTDTENECAKSFSIAFEKQANDAKNCGNIQKMDEFLNNIIDVGVKSEIQEITNQMIKEEPVNIDQESHQSAFITDDNLDDQIDGSDYSGIVIVSKIKKEPKDKGYKCNSCGKLYVQSHHLTRHIQTVHSVFKNRKCKLCLKSFDTSKMMQEHFEICKTKRDCVACGKTFSMDKDLKAHILKAHAGEKIFKCDSCSKSFKIFKTLKEHIAYTHEEIECMTCRSSFGGKQELKEHIELAHGVSTQICTTCGITFSDKNELKDHNNLTHGLVYEYKNGAKHKCNECEKSFTSESNLQKHIYTIHMGRRDFVCTTCGKSFVVKALLEHHVKFFHEGEKLDCKLCDKKFNFATSLKQHIFVAHEDHPDHKCKVCGKIFYYKEELQNHILTAHEGRRDHKCETCGKSFIQKIALKNHVNVVHLGLGQRHTCEKCGNSFR